MALSPELAGLTPIMAAAKRRGGSPKKMQEALACVVLLALATAAFGQGVCDHHHSALAACFVGPAIATTGSVARSESASAAKSGVQPGNREREQQQQRQQQRRQHRTTTTGTGVDATSPLARRILLRRALAKPRLRTAAGGRGESSTRGGSGSGTEATPESSPNSSSRTGMDVGNLFRFGDLM